MTYYLFSSDIPDACDGIGYLTVYDGGRLGNKMSQYSTLLAHASRLGVPAVISEVMMKDLIQHFPNIRYYQKHDPVRKIYKNTKIEKYKQ